MQQVNMVREAAEFVRAKTGPDFQPQLGLTLGTGLSQLAGQIRSSVRIPYAEIPHFPVSTVQSHAGEMILGGLGGKSIAALAGRFHLYEGYSPKQITFPIRVLAQLGISSFIFCNAAGGLNLDMQAGQVMLIKDHINFTGENPLAGQNVDQWGERFPDMSQVYDPHMIELARKAAAEHAITLHEGVYVGLKGPSMETPAETAMLRGFGADAVGMSTVLEVIAAKHHGLKIMGFSAIANMNDPRAMEPAPIELVIKNAEMAGNDLSRLITGVLARLS
jgi:purine-nucleoside phosphorylase